METELAAKIVSGLKSAGISFVSYLPETRLSQIMPLLREDPSFMTVPVKALEQNVLRFIVCKVEPTTGHRQIERPNEDLWEHKYRFVRYLERTEGKKIFIGRG